MNELLQILMKRSRIIWALMITSQFSYLPIMYFAIDIEHSKGPAHGHLEGFEPIFLICSIIMGIVSIFQYKKLTKYERMKIL